MANIGLGDENHGYAWQSVRTAGQDPDRPGTRGLNLNLASSTSGDGSSATAHAVPGSRKHPLVWFGISTLIVLAFVRLAASMGPVTTWAGWVRNPLPASVIGLLLGIGFSMLFVVPIYITSKDPSKKGGVWRSIGNIGLVLLMIPTFLLSTVCVTWIYFTLAGAYGSRNLYSGSSPFGIPTVELGQDIKQYLVMIVVGLAVTWFVRGMYVVARL